MIFGTPVAVAIAKGVHDWIAKNGNRVTIKTADGTVIATGDAARNIDVGQTVEALGGKP